MEIGEVTKRITVIPLEPPGATPEPTPAPKTEPAPEKEKEPAE